MDVNENLRNLSQIDRELIKQSYLKVFGKMRPDSTALNHLYDLFKENIDPTFTGTCSKCKRRVVTYWMQRLKNWKMI